MYKIWQIAQNIDADKFKFKTIYSARVDLPKDVTVIVDNELKELENDPTAPSFYGTDKNNKTVNCDLTIIYVYIYFMIIFETNV